MKMLIIGNAASVFIKNFVKEITRIIPSMKVDILSLALSKHVDYDENVRIIDVNSLVFDQWGWTRKIALLRRVVKFYFVKKFLSTNHYDICHIHYVNPIYGLFSMEIKRSSKHIIASLWGSDLYKTTSAQRAKQKKLFQTADIITFANEKSRDYFNNIWGNEFHAQKYIARFGLRPLEKIKKHLPQGKNKARAHLGLPTEKTIITCGYNANPGQQHFDIIKSISSIYKHIPKNSIFVFPMTYGSSTHRRDVEQELKANSFDYSIFRNFLNADDIAQLWIASDIMINVQVTDQLSGSMQECIYAGNRIITGSWLPYNCFVKNCTGIISVSSVNDIGQVLLKMLNNPPIIDHKVNREYIWKLSSWESTINQWGQLYNSLIYG